VLDQVTAQATAPTIILQTKLLLQILTVNDYTDSKISVPNSGTCYILLPILHSDIQVKD